MYEGPRLCIALYGGDMYFEKITPPLVWKNGIHVGKSIKRILLYCGCEMLVTWIRINGVGENEVGQ